MNLQIYADESTTDKSWLLGGFIATPECWARFSKRWKAVLNRYRAPYFHFREFVDKEDKWKIKGNPYLHWSEKQRESFLYELAIVLSEEAVPVGGCVDIVKFRASGLQGDTNEGLIVSFYTAVEQTLNSHWPKFDGEVLFVFDETDNSKWVATLDAYHQHVRKVEQRIGGLSFEDDRSCPPLQAADLYAYACRQISERYYAQNNKVQVKRTLDWILSKNAYPKFKRMHTPAQWEKLVRLVLADEKQKKALWARQGESGKKYYPEEHFDPRKHGLKLLDMSNP